MSPATPFGILILCFASLVFCHGSSHKSQFERHHHRSECKADAKEAWSYRGENGPKHWAENFTMCNGTEQSPIAIIRISAIQDSELKTLEMINYNIPITAATIENNGHTVQVTPSDDVERTISVNNTIYSLVQMHFHWGNVFYRGSEHTVDGKRYAMELHLVHRNLNNELAVVGVFFKELFMISNPAIQTLIEFFPDVLYKGDQTQLTSSLNLTELVPANPSSYYRYAGSLTTPDCAQGVTWSVLTEPLLVGHRQMHAFRKLYSATEDDATSKCKQSNNYRPVQPLNGRQVFKSE